MRTVFALLTAAALALAGPAARADDAPVEIGGDRYFSGAGSADAGDAPRDVFAAGAAVTLRGAAAGDAHAAGFDVDVEIAAENVYAAGGALTVAGRVAEDLTAAGLSVKTAPGAATGGNARLAGGTLIIEGPVAGALVAFGGEIVLNAEVGGDARLTAGTISFGPRARVGGALVYSATDEVAVPPEVAPPARVSFRPLAVPGLFDDWEEAWKDRRGGAWSALGLVAGFLILLGFLMIVAALGLAFAPAEVEARRRSALAQPGMTVLVGVLFLSLLVGLAPVSAATVIGLPLLPIILLAALLLWTVGYVLGAYVVAARLWRSLDGGAPSTTRGRLGPLAAALALLLFLNVVPVLGWLLNLLVGLFGVGAVGSGLLERLAAWRARRDAA